MNTEVSLAGIVMKNPVMTASGTCGAYGKEISQFYDPDRLGAFVPKSATLYPRQGNPPPRVVETASGMINSIGLQNDGIDAFLREGIEYLNQYDVPLIVNLSENSVVDFEKAAEKLSVPRVYGLEINVSCPNVEGEGMLFGKDPEATYTIVKAVKNATDKPIITKLTPNVNDIVEIAHAAYDAGTDALSMINTVVGMAIDAEKQQSKIHGGGRYCGGLSGPCVKPVGVYNVYQVHKSGINVPIIGMGGITNGEDAVEYMLAGASAVSVGTGNFTDPYTPINVIEGIEDYMKRHEIDDVNKIIGGLKDL
ncbi:dihydroorotate dehydrogenase [Candidatus Woesearchaeota archaeon]|nr:dihydroorotate dehydrogenase [Candidatus Woesearchaeota archaeon]